MNRKFKAGTTVSEIPRLLDDWDYAANTDISPQTVTYGSEKIAGWVCATCTHKWSTKIYVRSRGNGCPMCGLTSKRAPISRGNLQDEYPDIARELDDAVNPTSIASGSGMLFWWKCTKAHRWQATPKNRTKGQGCPTCHKLPKKGKSIQNTHPELVKQLHPTLNGDFVADTVTRGSRMRVWWLCVNQHVWEAAIQDRTHVKRPTGCPLCYKQSRKKIGSA